MMRRGPAWEGLKQYPDLRHPQSQRHEVISRMAYTDMEHNNDRELPFVDKGESD
jgi:hypothetical protein